MPAPTVASLSLAFGLLVTYALSASARDPISDPISFLSNLPHSDRFAPPIHAPCLRLWSAGIAQAASCGHTGSATYFLSILPDALTVADVEACFTNAGCSQPEAVREARRSLDACRLSPACPLSLSLSSSSYDLRRRVPRPQKQLPGLGKIYSDLDVAILPHAGQKDSPATGPTTQGANLQTQPAPAGSTAPSAAPASPVTQPPPSPASSGSLVCSINAQVSTTFCPVQQTGPDAGRFLPCFPTVLLVPTCAPGLLCSSDGLACIRAQTTLSISGIIVTAAFSAALVSSIGVLAFFGLRDRAARKRLNRRAEAAAAAKAALSAAKPGTVSADVAAAEHARDVQPLIHDPSTLKPPRSPFEPTRV